MKVFVSLGKVENCPDSRKNALNPIWVGMVDPRERCSIWNLRQRYKNPLLYRESITQQFQEFTFFNNSP